CDRARTPWSSPLFRLPQLQCQPPVREASAVQRVSAIRRLSPVAGHPSSTPQVLLVLAASAGEASRDQLQAASGLRDRMHFTREYLRPLLDAGWIEMTIPERP